MEFDAPLSHAVGDQDDDKGRRKIVWESK